MNSPLETGLFLPIRFYNTLAEQDRYKRSSLGTSLVNEVFIYVDCKTLAPFQIVKAFSIAHNDAIWKLICVDGTETITLPYNSAAWEYYGDGTYTWISYLGTENLTGYLNNGLYYLEVTLVDNNSETFIYYSDLFVVANCDDLYATTDYRLTSQSIMDKRLINATDLRIIKT
jgi:hypothetical protein